MISRSIQMLLFQALLLLLALGNWTLLAAELIDDLRIHQIQVIGSHNSYKTAIDPDLFRLMEDFYPKAQSLDYAHPSLTDQLNLGLRNLELDVFHDPEGGRYAKPLGLSMVRAAGGESRPYDPHGKMHEPGFKVFHIQDIDFRSHCLTLHDALVEIRNWSNRHPWHLPLIITWNLKDRAINLAGSVEPLRFDQAALAALDEKLLSTLGKAKLILPDDVRGDYETLEAAVRASMWPTLAEARGRVLLVLDESGQKRDDYLVGHPGLRGRAMFVNSEPGHPEAAVVILNDPLTEGKTITQLVSQGYLVRTRADAGTHEAQKGDYSRFEAAKQSGAQVITTDYYQADWRLHPTYRIRFDEGTFCRLNPVTGPTPKEKAEDMQLEQVQGIP
ncbi:MAG: phosphatidylinositol-specific phospholipase C1-like protein [Pirellulales bacterium]|nr:phosphatidylinositol-specific phospholipase C1-like protein [Pirellulales bacterium]